MEVIYFWSGAAGEKWTFSDSKTRKQPGPLVPPRTTTTPTTPTPSLLPLSQPRQARSQVRTPRQLFGCDSAATAMLPFLRECDDVFFFSSPEGKYLISIPLVRSRYFGWGAKKKKKRTERGKQSGEQPHFSFNSPLSCDGTK